MVTVKFFSQNHFKEAIEENKFWIIQYDFMQHPNFEVKTTNCSDIVVDRLL